jgi:CubicO group peptidase (beta-lactamase class C family)
VRSTGPVTRPMAAAAAAAAAAPPPLCVPLPVVPGAPARAVGAVVCGVTVLEQAAGEAAGAPCSVHDTLFSVASISKLVMAVLTLQCVERGELSLDEDVNARLPARCRAAHPAHADAPVTPRMLLQHRAGLRDDESALRQGPWRAEGADCPVSLADYVAARLGAAARTEDAAALWHRKRPGAAPYHYSNLGITLLGLTLETACGASVARLARERIFEPLGMTRSAFTLADAAAHLPAAARIAVPHDAAGAPVGIYGVAEYPAAGLRASLHDLLIFLGQFTTAADAPDGGCALLSRASLAAMLPEDYERGLAWWGLDATYGEKE